MATVVRYSNTAYDPGYVTLPVSDTLFAEWGPRNATGSVYTFSPPLTFVLYNRRNSTIGLKNTSALQMFFGANTAAERQSVYSNANVGVSVKRGLGLFLYDIGSGYLAHTPAGRGDSCWGGFPGSSSMADWTSGTSGSWTDTCKGSGDGFTAVSTLANYGELTILNVLTRTNGSTMAVGYYTEDNLFNYTSDIPWCGMMYSSYNWSCSVGFPYQYKARKLCHISSL